MVAQYLVSQGATNSQKSERSDKAVISARVCKERTFHFHMLVESLCIVVPKYISQQCFSFVFIFSPNFKFDNCYSSEIKELVLKSASRITTIKS